jgi:hypothetical protein
MLKTRDLLLFVAIVLCLFAGITITYVQETLGSVVGDSRALLGSASGAPETFIAETHTKEKNRTETIARLREAISQSGGSLATVNPSVEETSTEESLDDIDQTDAVAGIQRCGGGDDSVSAIEQWPLSNTAVVVKNGMRSVTHTSVVSVPQPVATSSGSTTKPTFESKLVTLLEMPLYPPKMTEPMCIQSDAIGVTTAGSLLFNADARTYFNRDAKELIGFARDGFPIYGPYEGAVDACGGYQHPEGYRYTLSLEREYVLGCFVGAPYAFVME